MKKILFLLSLILLPTFVAADRTQNRNVRSILGPGVSQNATLTIPANTYRNCLQSLDVTPEPSTANYIVKINDGATLIYQMVMSTGTAFIKTWDLESMPCGTASTAMTVVVASATVYNINYRGVVLTSPL